jgi:hypothetical protein
MAMVYSCSIGIVPTLIPSNKPLEQRPGLRDGTPNDSTSTLRNNAGEGLHADAWPRSRIGHASSN